MKHPTCLFVIALSLIISSCNYTGNKSNKFIGSWEKVTGEDRPQMEVKKLHFKKGMITHIWFVHILEEKEMVLFNIFSHFHILKVIHLSITTNTIDKL